MDLVNQSLQQVELTNEKQGEGLEHYALDSGDVVVIDRGYNQPRSLVPFIERGGSVVLRYNPHSMNLYSQQEQTGELEKFNRHWRLRQADGKAQCVAVVLSYKDRERGENQCVEGYLHARPLPPKQAREARRKAAERAKRRGGSATRATRFLAGWVLVFSTVPVNVLDTQTVAELYRVR